MVQSVKEIDFQDMVYAIPAFLTIVLMPFTYNIANGVSFGIVSYVVLASIANERAKRQAATRFTGSCGYSRFSSLRVMRLLAAKVNCIFNTGPIKDKRLLPY